MGMIGSCLVGSACQCICACFSSCGVSSKVFSRIGYVMFALVWILISTFLLYFAHYITISNLQGYLGCNVGLATESCIGLSSVYRMSFSLVVFRVLLFLFCSCRNPIMSKLNEGAWPLKFLVVLGIFSLTFLITNSFFRIYGYIAMGGSCLFLIYEMILVIDMAYSWNESWVDNFNNGEGNCWKIMLIGGTVIGLGGGIGLYVYMMINFARSAGDWVIMIGPNVAAFIYFILTIKSAPKGSSIFIASLFFF